MAKKGKIIGASWFIDGVEVDEQVVMKPETQTVKQILEDDDLERRRIRIERYGWLKFLREVNADVIDERVNDIDNTKEALFRFKNDDAEYTVLIPTCKTGRVFSLEVPSNIRTCEQAQKYLQADKEVADSGIDPMNPIGRS